MTAPIATNTQGPYAWSAGALPNHPGFPLPGDKLNAHSSKTPRSALPCPLPDRLPDTDEKTVRRWFEAYGPVVAVKVRG